MIGDRPVERRLAQYFAEERTTRAPEWVLASVVTEVDRIGQRRGASPRATDRWRAMPRSRRLALLLAAALAIAGAVAVGSFLLMRPQPTGGSSTLILVERPQGALGDPTVPVSVVSVDLEGRVKALATLTSDTLGGTYSEWWADVSPDGHLVVPVDTDGEVRPGVVDLRSPGQRAALPDAAGAQPAFGPDGRLAFQTNSGRFAIFDPLARSTTFTPAPLGGGPFQVPFAPIWAATSEGFIGQGDTVGLFRLDGTFTPGQTPAYFGGVGPRRIDAAGRYLDCPSCAGGPGVLTASTRLGGREQVWLDDRSDLDVADFAWASDGGIWMLLESVAPGPRDLMLVKVVDSQRLDRYADFRTAADDPDPGSYSPGGSFAAMAPGDTRLVIRVTSVVSGGHDELWSVDPSTRTTARLPDGIAAGWLSPTTLTAARPTVAPLRESDRAVRGVWSSGSRTITLQRTSVLLGSGPSSGALTVDSGDGQTLTVAGSAPGAACTAGQTGTYRWSVTSDRLELVVIDDTCPGRQARLAGTYRRALPYPDTGTSPVTGGVRYLVTDADVPYTIMPPQGFESVVSAHGVNHAMLSHGDAQGGVSDVSVLRPTGGVSEVCQRYSRGLSVAPSSDAYAMYLLGLAPEITVREVERILIDGRSARTFDIDASRCQANALFTISTGNFGTVGTYGPRTRVHLVDIEGGGVMIVMSSVGAAATADLDRWIDQTIASIRFEPSS